MASVRPMFHLRTPTPIIRIRPLDKLGGSIKDISGDSDAVDIEVLSPLTQTLGTFTAARGLVGTETWVQATLTVDFADVAAEVGIWKARISSVGRGRSYVGDTGILIYGDAADGGSDWD